MSTDSPLEPSLRNPDTSSAAPNASFQPSKSRRVLACVLCQQRKVKCDRQFPCANCIKLRVRCVPATFTPRQRKRRFPERELIERLRHYEDLLHKNNIKFDPLHNDSAGPKQSSNADGSYDSEDEQLAGESTSGKSETVYDSRTFWSVMRDGFRDPGDNDDFSQANFNGVETEFERAWDQLFENSDHLLFASRRTDVDLHNLHPEPVTILKLWHIYLDNVNPLLKVTHTPSLQRRIVEAASNLPNINPDLESLLFSIYCSSISTISENECQALFSSPKEDVLLGYRFACQQALLNGGFLQSSNIDCCTALFLYLVSVRESTHPRSLSCMLSIAIRIAQRMGIHNESTYVKHTILEAEIRRRLWWSIVSFDTRIGEISGSSTTLLVPTWDCKVPLNVNDTDLQPEMKKAPVGQTGCTEALFTVIRSEILEFIRHANFHHEFASPTLRTKIKEFHRGQVLEGREIADLEKAIEEKYLRHCDPENPMHCVSIWMSRVYLAKCNLVEHYSRYYGLFAHQTDALRDTAIAYAIRMLDGDTKLISTQNTRIFYWLVQLFFPLPAYVHIVQDLRKRPLSQLAEKAWQAMSNNYEARLIFFQWNSHPFFRRFAQVALQSWEARLAMSPSSKEPGIIPYLRYHTKKPAPNEPTPETEHFDGSDIDIYDLPISTPMSFGAQDAFYGNAGTEPAFYPNMPGFTFQDNEHCQLDWTNMK